MGGDLRWDTYIQQCEECGELMFDCGESECQLAAENERLSREYGTSGVKRRSRRLLGKKLSGGIYFHVTLRNLSYDQNSA